MNYLKSLDFKTIAQLAIGLIAAALILFGIYTLVSSYLGLLRQTANNTANIQTIVTFLQAATKPTPGLETPSSTTSTIN